MLAARCTQGVPPSEPRLQIVCWDIGVEGRVSRHLVMTVLRWLAGVAVFAFFMFWSFFLATLIGWDFRPEGPHRVTGHWNILLAAVVAGLAAIITARLILRRRPLSWWLLLALPIPTLVALDQGGWL